jgi:glycosyltransferase involved in cell wall biosynthesis
VTSESVPAARIALLEQAELASASPVDRQAAAISIVIPAYREAAKIADVVTQTLTVAALLGETSELLVVDDGSPDGTADVAQRAGARVVRHPYNRGYGAALKTGIRHAQGDTVVMLDADGQHDPRDIPALLAQRTRYDMVVGDRGRGGHSPGWRRPGKAVLGWLANYLTERKIPDLNSGFRAMDRRMALRMLPILPNGFSLSTTITIAAFKAGYNVGYVPINAAKREGTSTVSAADGLNTLMLIVRIISLFAPLRVFLPVAIVTFLIGMGFIISSYFSVEQASIRGILMVLASILFFLFGLLADQIAALRRGERVLDI